MLTLKWVFSSKNEYISADLLDTFRQGHAMPRMGTCLCQYRKGVNFKGWAQHVSKVEKINGRIYIHGMRQASTLLDFKHIEKLSIMMEERKKIHKWIIIVIFS